jgi:hypothetical protein
MLGHLVLVDDFTHRDANLVRTHQLGRIHSDFDLL